MKVKGKWVYYEFAYFMHILIELAKSVLFEFENWF